MRVLIIGASGMLGHVLFDLARNISELHVWGTVKNRSEQILGCLDASPEQIFECDLTQSQNIDPKLYCAPEIVINCAINIMYLCVWDNFF